MLIANWIIVVLICVSLVFLCAAAAAHIAMALSHRKAAMELRREIEATLGRVDTVLNSAEALLRDEVAPTLKIARQTLQNVEVTTRALADTTIAARSVVNRLERTTSSSKLVQVGGIATTLLIKKGSCAAANLFKNAALGVGHAILGLGRHRARGAAVAPQSNAMVRNAAIDTSDMPSEAVEARK